jgi:hypothetical protein
VRRACRIALALIVAVVPAEAHATVWRCPLAPIQGPICKYVDPQLLHTLWSEGEAELLRWSSLSSLTPMVERVTMRQGVSTTNLVEYDSVLRTLKTPTAPVPSVFAAAWNVTHPTAQVRLVVANGGVQIVNFAQLATTKVDSLHALGNDDPVKRVGAAVARLSAAAGVPASAGVGRQLLAMVDAGRSARDSDSTAAGRATDLAAAARARSSGMQGESEARVLSSKGAVDLLRALSEQHRGDAALHTIDAVHAAQEARAARSAMLQQWATMHSVVRP